MKGFPAFALAGSLLLCGRRELDTVHGRFTVHVAQNLATRRHAFALTRGELGSAEPLLARVHSSCVTSESYGACDCDCAMQLDTALAAIAGRGRGVVFYLMQEGRGAGFGVKARDRMMVQASRHRLDTFEAYRQMGIGPDHRSYAEVAPLARLLGVRSPLLLLTSNPEKLHALERIVRVTGSQPLNSEDSPYNRHYLEAKIRSGHRLLPSRDRALADLPEPVRVFEPYPLAADPRFVHLATYLLPVLDAGGPHWFRLFAYFDLESGVERVVLGYGGEGAAVPLVRVQHERLLERFPLSTGRRERRRFAASVAQIVAAGAGWIGLVASHGFDAGLDERAGDPSSVAILLAHHLAGRIARPLVAPDEGDAAGQAVAALQRAGAALGPALDLAA